MQRFSAGTSRERRLLLKGQRESGFWEHLRDFGTDFNETYIEGMGRKDTLDKITAAFAGAMQVILRGGDAVYDAAIGRKFEAPHGIAGNTWRDLKALGSDVLHLRPLHILGDVWKLATSSIPQDIGDGLAGLRQSSIHQHIGNVRKSSKRKIDRALSHEPSLAMGS